MAKNEAKIKFSADTEKFDAAIKSSNSELQSLRAELKLNEAQFKNNGDSSEYLAQKHKLLQNELEANQQKQEALNSKIEVATQMFGEDSAEVQKLQTALTYAQIQEENIKGAIDGANDALNSQTSESNGAGDALKQMSDIQASQFMQDLSEKALEAAKAVFEVATAAAETEDTIDKMSQRLGMSADAYQTWEYILSQSGVEITSMRTGFKTLTNTIGKATEAGSTAGTAFEKLGISFDDIKGKSQEDIFAQTIYALQSVDDQTQKATLAQKLFGRSGQEMIPLLNQSKESTQELAEKAHELGIVLGDEAVQKGVEFHDTMDTLDRSFNSISTSIGTAFMPVIEGVVEVIQPIAPVVQEISGITGEFVAQHPMLQAALVGITTAFIALGVALGISATIKTVQTAMVALNATLLANPITWVVIGITAFVAALIYAYKNSETFRNGVNKAFSSVKSVVLGVMNGVKTAINGGIAVFKAIMNTVDNFKNKITSAFDKVKSSVAQIKSLFPLHLGKIFQGVKLPHFKISGGEAPWGIGGKGTKPSVGIDWYAKAMNRPMILNGATIFGANGNTLLAGGESGPEMIGGVTTVSSMIESAVTRGMSSMMGGNLVAVAREIARNINFVVKLNNREIGRVLDQ